MKCDVEKNIHDWAKDGFEQVAEQIGLCLQIFAEIAEKSKSFDDTLENHGSAIDRLITASKLANDCVKISIELVSKHGRRIADLEKKVEALSAAPSTGEVPVSDFTADPHDQDPWTWN